MGVVLLPYYWGSWAACLFILVLHVTCGINAAGGAAPAFSASTRDVLLAFRKAITLDPTQALTSWTNTTTNNFSSAALNYCSWKGVVCHPNTQQVKGISLEELHLQGSITPMLGRLAHLSHLNLSFNQLSGTIPVELGSCTGLLELALNDNRLQGLLPAELSNLTQLQIFSASANNLTGSLPRLVLPALQELNLTANSLQGELMSLLPGCSSLRVLDLSRNNFEGPIPDAIRNLSHLGFLELTDNNFTSISPFIANCTRLYHFNVWSNRIVGAVPADWFTGFPGLSFLTLGENQFTGNLPTNIGALSQLQNLVLLQNNFQGQILHYLQNCSSLSILDVSNNKFTDSIPAQLGSSWPLLVKLDLEINHFYGALPASIVNCSNLEVLDLGYNYGISGPLPRQMFHLWKLQHLDLQSNNFTGELPSDFGNQSSALSILILNNNNFIGSLPAQLGLLKSLAGATFENNRFSGNIPQELGNCTNMLHFVAHDNLLTGAVPWSLGHVGVLELLHLEHNQLSGSIPLSLSNCTRLSILYLNHNSLEGNILPVGFSFMLELDLSNNALSGSIPSELISSMTQVSSLDLSFNKLSGSVPSALENCVTLFYLNLSSNQLTGAIPASLGNSLRSLQNLNLSHNFFSGPIPPQLANLTSLRTLDLSFNNLSGEIPQSLTNLSFTAASFRGNPQLCGLVLHLPCPAPRRASNSPSALVIGLIVAASLLLLVLLTLSIAFLVRCLKHKAMPADIQSPFLRMTLKEIREATDNFSQDNILGSGGSSIVYKGTTRDGKTLAFKKMFVSRSTPESSFFAEIKSVGQVRHRNLVKVLGYYSDLENDILIMDYMPNGNLSDHLHGAVALSKASESTSSGKHEELSSSTSISSGGHAPANMMAWKDRVEIAKGIATGLAYLHHDCPTPIIHLDIKPTNILLDADMNPRISDFGLARVMQAAASHASTDNIKGSFCYMAPEYASFGKVSKMCDVYSYGIVVMEIVTGRSPTSEMFDEGQILNKWVSSKMQSGDKFDDRFIGICLDTQYYNNEEREQVALLLNVAILCTKENPNERPTMKNVTEQLEGMNAGFQVPQPFEKMIEEVI